MGSNTGACTIANTVGASPCGQIEGDKCNGATAATWIVPGDATSITVQLHDGLFKGDFDCGENGANSLCAGGDGGSCTEGINAVCQVNIALSTCGAVDEGPTTGACQNSTECESFDTDCGTGTCVAGACTTVPKAEGFECREAKVGINGALSCDVAEVCNGKDTTCPDNKYAAKSVECRPAAGACDVAEFCTESSPDCPTDVLRNSTHECRASDGVCDVAEFCDGNSTACPADVLKGPEVECRASAGACDAAEMCSGDSATCGEDKKHPATYTCRSDAANKCDVAEMCDGTSDDCPVDQVKSQGYSIKCATTIYVCAIPYSDPKIANGNAYSLGGCTLGTAKKNELLPAIKELKWPDCMNQCIDTPCENNRGLSNMVFFDCAASTGAWTCNSKVDVSSNTPVPYCQNTRVPNWAPVPI
ncbi:MAG: hypothetical protein J3K34DRAFT_415072 [Monoraphidium minutum]|nr:MAG: hypothetical protein J3K34DRAFT_415072 [Monoraphidium minutum]